MMLFLLLLGFGPRSTGWTVRYLLVKYKIEFEFQKCLVSSSFKVQIYDVYNVFSGSKDGRSAGLSIFDYNVISLTLRSNQCTVFSTEGCNKYTFCYKYKQSRGTACIYQSEQTVISIDWLSSLLFQCSLHHIFLLNSTFTFGNGIKKKYSVLPFVVIRVCHHLPIKSFGSNQFVS